ncbi:hypothetical protein EYZ11_009751 [Aspergillus tanneri]|nr:hypothetical protein EYZ11_009751 [Aspergillus tanneri]
MSTLYKLAATGNTPEINWNDNHLRALAHLDDEEIDILRLPSPCCLIRHTPTEFSHISHWPNQNKRRPWRLGICAMEEKALSKSNQEIFRRLESTGDIEVTLFGDKTLLTKPVEKWPICDSIIAFYSNGFPLDKAILYTHLRSPICYNSLLMQKLLFDRRLCHRVLDYLGVRTPKRLEVNRDGGPRALCQELVVHVYNLLGLELPGPLEDDKVNKFPFIQSPTVSLSEDKNTLEVDGHKLHKPFVEKPVSAEDHNIYIYFSSTPYSDGGGRRLFRKIGNKCSEYDPCLIVPRCITEQGMSSSYVYEPLLNADNGEDIKAYAVGSSYCFAVTRKSPAVTGMVHRDTNGKEIRQITEVSKEEAEAAANISVGFGQAVCGFDIVRNGGKSYVIDVNGWTSVKNQPRFYSDCAETLRKMLLDRKARDNLTFRH